MKKDTILIIREGLNVAFCKERSYFAHSFGFSENYFYELRSQDILFWLKSIENPEPPTIVNLVDSKVFLQKNDYTKLKGLLEKIYPNHVMIF